MTDARADILSGIRRSLSKAPLGEAARPEAPVPARGRVPEAERPALFTRLAQAVDATVAHIASFEDLPGAVADYLASQNLPAEFAASPDPVFDGVPWSARPTLIVRRGAPGRDDAVALTCAFAGVAETGSLLMWGDSANAHTASFLPETAIVALPASRLVGTFEEAWERVREAGALPRALSFVTGPSRTGDIELRLELGAHGPRRLHVVIVDDRADE
jgi:L-lactate dehydrogenase complex protein LldG